MQLAMGEIPDPQATNVMFFPSRVERENPFLMGGVVTDYTEIGLVWHNIGRKTALWLVAVSVPQTLLLGWVLNVVL